MGHSHKMSTCDYAQKAAYIGKILIKLWNSSIENHIRQKSFKILAIAVGRTLKKKNLQNLHKIQIIYNPNWISLKTLIKWSMEPSYSLIKVRNSDCLILYFLRKKIVFTFWLDCSVSYVTFQTKTFCAALQLFCSF